MALEIVAPVVHLLLRKYIFTGGTSNTVCKGFLEMIPRPEVNDLADIRVFIIPLGNKTDM